MVVAPRPEEAILDEREPTVPVVCRDCGTHALARLSSLDRAVKAEYRRDRPVKFFCWPCAMQYQRSSIDVLEDLRPSRSDA